MLAGCVSEVLRCLLLLVDPFWGLQKHLDKSGALFLLSHTSDFLRLRNFLFASLSTYKELNICIYILS